MGLVGKPEGKRPQGRPRRRWEDNIRIDLQEVGCGGLDWIGLGGNFECGKEPSDCIKCEEFLGYKPVSSSRRTLLHGVSKYEMSIGIYYILFLNFTR
jgi:hypothetical protein